MTRHPSQSNGHKKLTLKQELFIEAYLGKAKGNATEAARIAGYSGNDNTLAQTGLKLVRNGNLKPRIQARMKEVKKLLSADEVLQNLSRLGQSAEKQSDQIRALELVGRYYALFTDKLDRNDNKEAYQTIKDLAEKWAEEYNTSVEEQLQWLVDNKKDLAPALKARIVSELEN